MTLVKGGDILMSASAIQSVDKHDQAPAIAAELSFFTTKIDLPQSDLAAAIKPESLLARLASIRSEWLPEDSGLNE